MPLQCLLFSQSTHSICIIQLLLLPPQCLLFSQSTHSICILHLLPSQLQCLLFSQSTHSTHVIHLLLLHSNVNSYHDPLILFFPPPDSFATLSTFFFPLFPQSTHSICILHLLPLPLQCLLFSQSTHSTYNSSGIFQQRTAPNS